MVDVVLVIVLLVILGAAVVYIVREKKRGTRCIGCPDSGNCSHGQNGTFECIGCGRNCTENTKKIRI